jgi:hypothetical protein
MATLDASFLLRRGITSARSPMGRVRRDCLRLMLHTDLPGGDRARSCCRWTGASRTLSCGFDTTNQISLRYSYHPSPPRIHPYKGDWRASAIESVVVAAWRRRRRRCRRNHLKWTGLALCRHSVFRPPAEVISIVLVYPVDAFENRPPGFLAFGRLAISHSRSFPRQAQQGAGPRTQRPTVSIPSQCGERLWRSR